MELEEKFVPPGQLAMMLGGGKVGSYAIPIFIRQGERGEIVEAGAESRGTKLTTCDRNKCVVVISVGKKTEWRSGRKAGITLKVEEEQPRRDACGLNAGEGS